MRLAGLHPGDPVEVDVKGRVFPARFQGPVQTDLGPRIFIQPLSRTITYFHVRARQIRRRLSDVELAREVDSGDAPACDPLTGGVRAGTLFDPSSVGV